MAHADLLPVLALETVTGNSDYNQSNIRSFKPAAGPRLLARGQTVTAGPDQDSETTLRLQVRSLAAEPESTASRAQAAGPRPRMSLLVPVTVSKGQPRPAGQRARPESP